MMQENAIEDRKYAFLLGSALRNEETDQLLIIYDNLIPRDIAPSRLLHIKEEARIISELPEEEFNALVLNARNFSLASGHYSMTSHTGCCISEDEEARTVGGSMAEDHNVSGNHSSLLYSNQKGCLGLGKEGLANSLTLNLPADEDSGFPTSKATGSSSGSIGADDIEDDHPGAFDYMPCLSHVKIRETHNPHYDEEVKVGSSTGDSSVESPRSENSVTHDDYNVTNMEKGREMQDMSLHSASYHDDAAGISGHKYLYSYLEQPRMNTERVLNQSYNYQEDAKFQSDTEKVKKKFSSKDDSDKLVTTHVDVNGNPQPFELHNYRQMRSSPKVENSSNPLDHGVSSLGTSNQENSKFEEKKRAKERKKQKQQGKLVKSDECQNYKGEEDLNFLLEYIEGKSLKDHNASIPSSPVGQETVGVKGEKGKKRTEKAVSKERQNDGNGKPTVEVYPANGPSSITVLTPEDVIMGNSSIKDSQNDIEVIIKTSSKIVLSEKRANSNAEDDLPDLINESGSTLYKVEQESEPAKTIKGEEKASTINVAHPSSRDTDLGKTQGKNKKPSKQKESKNVIPHKEKEEMNSILQNGPASPVANKFIDSQNFLCVDSSLSSGVIPGLELNSESKREPAFTEVKKKKKRIGARDSFLPTAPTYSHSIPPNNFMYKNNGPSFRPRQRAVSPSTMPSHNNFSATTARNVSQAASLSTNADGLTVAYITGNHTLSRDLSPSSFPVLPGHGQPGAARSEGRRNSCGDINTDIVENRVLYDSDKESVKSLPAAPGTRPIGESSPMCMVTYASMAAAPRRSDIPNSPSSESGVASGSQNGSINGYPGHNSSMETVPSQSPSAPSPDRKTTVWKGSPRERRHSEGDNSSLNLRDRQKSGSQECLTMTSICATTDSTPVGPAHVVCPSSSTNSLPSDVDLQDDVVETSSKMAGIDTYAKASPLSPGPLAKQPTGDIVPTSTYANQATTSSANLASPCADSRNLSTHQFPLSPSVSPLSLKDKTDRTAKITTKQPADVRSEDLPKPSTPVTKKPSTPESSKKSPATTTTINNSKSVIFLDKLGGKVPNLGITFGFDSSFQPAIETDDKCTVQQASPSSIVNSSSSSSSSPALPSLAGSQSSAGAKSPSCSPASSNIPQLMAVPQMTALGSSSHLSSSLNDTPVDKNSGVKTNKVPNGPHIDGSSNGIILPAKSAHLAAAAALSHTPSATSMASSLPGHDNSQPSSVYSISVCSSSSSSPVSIKTSSSGVGDTISKSVSKNNKLHLSSSKPVSNSSTTVTTPPIVGDTQHGPSPQLSVKTNRNTGAVSTAAAAPTTLDGVASINSPTTSVSLTSSTNSVHGSSEIAPMMKAKLESPAELANQSLPKELPSKQAGQSTVQPNWSELSSKYPNAKQVVYGLKIKPPGGCGTLLFLPPVVPKKQRRGNVPEVASFLRKQWTDVKDGQKKHPPSFVTVADT